MGVYKQKNSSGVVMWGIDYYDSSGKRVKKIISRNKKDAEDAWHTHKSEVVQEKVTGNKPVKKIYFSEWKTTFLTHSKTISKYRTYQSHTNSVKHLSQAFDNEFISDIDTGMINKYIEARLNGEYGEKKVGHSTVNRELACLKFMLNYAEKEGKLSKNHANKIKLFKEERGRIRWLTEEEIKRLIDACKLLYLRTIVVLALNTGMRRGEVLALKWSHINFELNKIHVEGTRGAEGILNTPKSGKGRYISMNNTAKKALLLWKEECKTEELFTVKEIKRSFMSACRLAGIKNFHFHDLRHTCASWMAMKGVDIAAISKFLGHSTIAMTMKYAHFSDDWELQAVKKLDTLFDGVE